MCVHQRLIFQKPTSTSINRYFFICYSTSIILSFILTSGIFYEIIKILGYLEIFPRLMFKHLISGIFHGNIKILGYLEIFLQTTVHYRRATCYGSTMILTLVHVTVYSVTFKTSYLHFIRNVRSKSIRSSE